MGVAIRSAFNAVINTGCAAADKAYKTADKGLLWASEIRKSPDATENSIRFVGFVALGVLQTTTPTTPLWKNLSVRLVDNADFLCSVQIFQNLNYWVNGGWREGDYLPKFANLVFTNVTASCVVLLLDQWKFLEVGQLAATIGTKVPLLKWVTERTVNEYLRSQLAIGFLLLDVHQLWCGYDNFIEFRRSQAECARLGASINTQQGNIPQLQAQLVLEKDKMDLAKLKLKQNMVDVAQFTSQVALNVLCVYGYGAASPVIIGWGLTSYGIGVFSFLYKNSNKATLERLENRINPPQILNPDEYPLFSSPSQFDPRHYLDFAARLVTKFEGLDNLCKLVGGMFEFQDKCRKSITQPYKNIKATLDANVEFNKFTNLFPRTQKQGEQVYKGKVSWKETIGSVGLLGVTIFESFSWCWSMNDLGKAGNVFKVWKNGFFITGLTANIVSDSYKLDKYDSRKNLATAKLQKWANHPLRTCNTTAEIRQLYTDKITNQPDSPKRANWQKKIDEIAALDAAGHVSYVARYKQHIQKKQDDWREIGAYLNNAKRGAGMARDNSAIKVVSLCVDMAVISLTVSKVTTAIIPVIGLQIAAIDRAKQVFTMVNLGLGLKGLYTIHFKEYFVDDFKNHLITKRNIKPAKLDV